MFLEIKEDRRRQYAECEHLHDMGKKELFRSVCRMYFQGFKTDCNHLEHRYEGGIDYFRQGETWWNPVDVKREITYYRKSQRAKKWKPATKEDFLAFLK